MVVILIWNNYENNKNNDNNNNNNNIINKTEQGSGYESLTIYPPCSGALAELSKESISYVMSVRLSAWNSSAPTGRIFVKIDLNVFLKYVEKIWVSFKSDKSNGRSTWRQIYIFNHIWLSSS